MRARLLLHTLPLLYGGALLLACSGPVTWPNDATVASSAATSADASYARGRSLHLAHRYDDAVAEYRAALQRDPTHINARNGLAVAYAERRDFAPAIAIWHELTAGATLSSGTGSAYLFVNLGYAHMLAGELNPAVVALEKACLLDPLNGRAWQYLGESLLALGQEERGRQMLSQADALRAHDLRADYAVAEGGSRLPAIEQALVTPARADTEWAVDEVVSTTSGLLQLRRVPAARTTTAAAAAAAPLQSVALLEISNGNGRLGMARQLSHQLRDSGLKVVRLTNEKKFDVRRTRIEYQPAFRAAAERLALRFGAGRTVEAGTSARADVRLVIGRDLASGADQPVLAQIDLPRSR